MGAVLGGTSVRPVISRPVISPLSPVPLSPVPLSPGFVRGAHSNMCPYLDPYLRPRVSR